MTEPTSNVTDLNTYKWVKAMRAEIRRLLILAGANPDAPAPQPDPSPPSDRQQPDDLLPRLRFAEIDERPDARTVFVKLGELWNKR